VSRKSHKNEEHREAKREQLKQHKHRPRERPTWKRVMRRV